MKTISFLEFTWQQDIATVASNAFWTIFLTNDRKVEKREKTFDLENAAEEWYFLTPSNLRTRAQNQKYRETRSMRYFINKIEEKMKMSN